MKKFLALVLALVMTMSLVTIGANAKTAYTDDAQITNQEAVEVLSAIGVLCGYDDGSFRPEAKLTRGAGAKLIAYLMLGQDAADKLKATYTVFSDVDDSVGLAAYIEWAAAQGIVDGYGDGTFGPKNTLTQYAFGKMLLGALGYNSEVEGFTGAGWQKNVYGIAVKNGVFDGTESFGACDRDTAARMEFAALQAEIVVYGQQIHNYWTSGQGQYEDSNLYNFWYGLISKEGAFGTGATLADLYGLSYEDGNDIYGRPGHAWSYYWTGWSKFYMDAPIAEYTERVTVCDVLVDAGIAKTSKAQANVVEFWSNGVEFDENGPKNLEGSYSHADCAGSFGGQGVLTQVFYDYYYRTYTVTEIYTYLAKVTDVVDSTHKVNAKTTLEVYYTTDPFDGDTFAKNVKETLTINDTTGYKEGDYVLVRISGNSVTDELDTYGAYEFEGAQRSADSKYVEIIGEPDVISYAAFSGIAADKSQITVDGVRKNVNVDYSLSYTGLEYVKGSPKYADFFVDQYGNVIGDVAPADDVYSYGVIEGLMWINDGGLRDAKWAEVKLVGADASIDYVNMAWYNWLDVTDVKTGVMGNPAAAEVSQYPSNNAAYYAANDQYDLGVVKFIDYGDSYGYAMVQPTYSHYVANSDIETGNPLVAAGHYADNDTVFLIRTTDASGYKYDSYVGINAIPDIKLCDVVVVYESSTDDYASFVFVDATNAIFAGSSVEAYVINPGWTYLEDGQWADYSVYVNGEKTTIRAYKSVISGNYDNLFGGNGGLYTLSFNTDGQVIKAESASSSYTSATTAAAVEDATAALKVTVGSSTVGLNLSAAKVYQVSYKTGTSNELRVEPMALEDIDASNLTVSYKLVSGSSFMVDTIYVWVPVVE